MKSARNQRDQQEVKEIIFCSVLLPNMVMKNHLYWQISDRQIRDWATENRTKCTRRGRQRHFGIFRGKILEDLYDLVKTARQGLKGKNKR